MNSCRLRCFHSHPHNIWTTFGEVDSLEAVAEIEQAEKVVRYLRGRMMDLNVKDRMDMVRQGWIRMDLIFCKGVSRFGVAYQSGVNF